MPQIEAKTEAEVEDARRQLRSLVGDAYRQGGGGRARMGRFGCPRPAGRRLDAHSPRSQPLRDVLASADAIAGMAADAGRVRERVADVRARAGAPVLALGRLRPAGSAPT